MSLAGLVCLLDELVLEHKRLSMSCSLSTFTVAALKVSENCWISFQRGFTNVMSGSCSLAIAFGSHGKIRPEPASIKCVKKKLNVGKEIMNFAQI